MADINAIDAMEALDNGKSFDSMVLLPDQCAAAIAGVESLTLADSYKNTSSILFAGMGGSAYGGRIIKSLYGNAMTVPIDMVNDYHIPSYVGPDTLVIVASYSGNTEEALSCAHEAIEKKAKVVGIASGGALAKLLSNANLPCFVFDPVHNPSNQPRLGQGYMQMGQIALLSKLGFLSISTKHMQSVVTFLRAHNAVFAQAVAQSSNPAKQYAIRMKDMIVNAIGAEFLGGAIHAIRNPFHETGKHFATYFLIPELNHHLLEGLAFPAINKEHLLFLLIRSDLYSARIEKRMNLTREVIEKQGLAILEWKLTGKTPLEQVFELIQLGSFVTYYLAMVHSVDPAKIPWVDFFKAKLS